MQTTDRPREIVIHQSANRPNQILGGDRELVLIAMPTAISLAFCMGSWWGDRPKPCVLGRSRGGTSTHGEGRSIAPANLHTAYPVQSVLSREKRASVALRAYPKELEVIHAAE